MKLQVKTTLGEEVILEIFHDNNPDRWYIDDVYMVTKEESKPEPSFKVGQWIRWENQGVKNVFRCVQVETNLVWDEKSNYLKSNCHPATNDEIKQHLIKIAIEKGFKQNVKAKFPRETRILTGKFLYDPDWGIKINEGALGMGNDVIWRADKGWVEIVLEKKKLRYV